jgi:hypothetical protein
MTTSADHLIPKRPVRRNRCEDRHKEAMKQPLILLKKKLAGKCLYLIDNERDQGEWKNLRSSSTFSTLQFIMESIDETLEEL